MGDVHHHFVDALLGAIRHVIFHTIAAHHPRGERPQRHVGVPHLPQLLSGAGGLRRHRQGRQFAADAQHHQISLRTRGGHGGHRQHLARLVHRHHIGKFRAQPENMPVGDDQVVGHREAGAEIVMPLGVERDHQHGGRPQAVGDLHRRQRLVGHGGGGCHGQAVGRGWLQQLVLRHEFPLFPQGSHLRPDPRAEPLRAPAPDAVQFVIRQPNRLVSRRCALLGCRRLAGGLRLGWFVRPEPGQARHCAENRCHRPRGQPTRPGSNPHRPFHISGLLGKSGPPASAPSSPSAASPSPGYARHGGFLAPTSWLRRQHRGVPQPPPWGGSPGVRGLGRQSGRRSRFRRCSGRGRPPAPGPRAAGRW